MTKTVAFSPCPNDTFIFHGIMTGQIQLPEALSIELRDIQKLNEGMEAEHFDFCKVSAVAALRNEERYRVLSAGAALGYGVGPLVVSRPGALPLGCDSRVLSPGRATTAFALFRHFFPDVSSVRQVVFSDIMPALLRGDAEYGVVIHEGRFVYQELGLECVADLGALWEQRYAVPLPLGCLVAHRRVEDSLCAGMEDAIRQSLSYGYAHREEAEGTMRMYAQELDTAALWAHVNLYVNQWSCDLGEVGRAAFGQLRRVVATL